MARQGRSITGVLAFVAVLLTMPLGHALMVLLDRVFGEVYQYHSAFALGAAGFVLLVVGMRRPDETAATWYGLFAGILMWTGWVEFSFVYYAHHIGVPPELEGNEVITKPEYLVLPSSLGLLLSTLLFFVMNKYTACRFFIWLRRRLRLEVNWERESLPRNFAWITALETIYVIWVFYVLLLIAYDDSIFGDHHWFTYFVFAGSLVWSGYLIVRLVKIRPMGAAIRYAIPTVVIFWNCVEMLGRWNFFEEIWIRPLDYTTEMILLLAAFLAVVVISRIMPERPLPGADCRGGHG